MGLWLGLVFCATAQNDLSPESEVTVGAIYVVGNEKTRRNIISRELTLEEGRTYTWGFLLEQLEADRAKVYNLLLFNQVTVQPIVYGQNTVDILVTVTERWYIYPNIILALADRNLAEWWTNQERDLSRVNFGMRVAHNNVAGRNEKLRIGGQLGFTEAFDVLYSIPYIDRNQKHGIAAQFTYFTQKTVALRSENNRQVFFTNENEEVLRRNTAAAIRYTYRGSFYNFHFVNIGFTNTLMNSDVLEENPNFFLHEGRRLRYFTAAYTFRHDRRNNNAYPTRGAFLEASLRKYGLLPSDDIQDLEFSFSASRFLPFGERFHLATGASGTYFFGRQQPYTLVTGIGYPPSFIRGYEFNVVEGQQFIVQKNSLRFKFLDYAWDLSDYIPFDEISFLPITFYLSANFDHGYVNDRMRLPENQRLANSYLFGYGLGLDFVSLYDLAIRFELSRNNNGENVFFINFRAPF